MKIEDFNLYNREVVDTLTGRTGTVIDIVGDQCCIAQSWGNSIIKIWVSKSSVRVIDAINRNQHAGIK